MSKITTLKSIALGMAFAVSMAVQSVPTFAAKTDTLIVAGGCFWCVESNFEQVKGVGDVVSGYTGGTVANPTYKQVGNGGTGHYEAVKIEFDPAVVSVDRLMDLFLHSADVLDAGGQFCDRGDTYRTAIFARPDQTAAAKSAIDRASAELGQKIVTPVLPAAQFWNAEDYHQNYYKGESRVLTRFGYIKQAEAYNNYRKGCGRDARVKQLWGDKAEFVHH